MCITINVSTWFPQNWCTSLYITMNNSCAHYSQVRWLQKGPTGMTILLHMQNAMNCNVVNTVAFSVFQSELRCTLTDQTAQKWLLWKAAFDLWHLKCLHLVNSHDVQKIKQMNQHLKKLHLCFKTKQQFAVFSPPNGLKMHSSEPEKSYSLVITSQFPISSKIFQLTIINLWL